MDVSSLISADNPLKPIVEGWLGKINKAIESKKSFSDTADELMNFFCGPVGFMWKDGYKHKLTDGAGPTPKFRFTINRAFEFVSLYGPVMFHRNPVRVVTPRQRLEIPPELFMDPMNPDPFAQQMM